MRTSNQTLHRDTGREVLLFGLGEEEKGGWLLDNPT
jgi:hypothetical protein